MNLRDKVDSLTDEIFNTSERIDRLYYNTDERITSDLRVHLHDKTIDLEEGLKEINELLNERFSEIDDDDEEEIKKIKRLFMRTKSSAKILYKSKEDLSELNSFVSTTFYNLKGGVAKTSLTYLAAIELADRGRKVLIIDLDPQGNITYFMNSKDKPIDILGTENLMTYKSRPREVISETKFKNVHVVGTDIDLIKTELDLHNRSTSREIILKSWFKENRDYLNDNYDNVFFDLSPSYSFLNVNGFVVADNIVYVANPSHSTIKGIRGFTKFYLDSINEHLDRDKKYAFVVNKVQKGRVLTRDFLNDLKEFKDLLEIKINPNIHYAEAIKQTIEKGDKLTKRDNERSYNEIVMMVDSLIERGIL